MTGIVRYVRNGAHDRITIRILGPTNSAIGGAGSPVPEQIVLRRGFRNSWDLRGRVIYERGPLRLASTLRFETSAVPGSLLNAAAIDGPKLEPSVAAEITLWRRWRIAASYAFSWMIPRTTTDSDFDPTAASACVSADGDLDSPACQTRRLGAARPSAAGRYSMMGHSLSLMTRVGF